MPTKSELDFHELPPLENDDLPDPQPNYDDLLDPLCDDRDDPKRLDDSTGEDDPFGDLLDVPAEESGLLDDNDDAQDFDSACPDGSDTFAEAPSVAEPDEVLADPDPLDIDFDEELGLDEGQEGPIGEDEELREEDLPALDADDQIGFDDPEGELLPADDGLPAPRAACMWSPAGAPLDVGPVRALVVLGRSVVVAGRSLFRVDLEGACESLDALGLVGSVRQLVAHGPWLVALTDRSELYVSKDAGATFEPRAEQVLHVASGTALYALFRGGELRRSDNGGDSWTAVRVPPVVAVTSACPGVIALEGLPSGVRAILRVEPRAGRSLCVEITDLG
ncbi:MAG: hypothetical protein WCI05_00355, partial [Myxococcales bacterium]